MKRQFLILIPLALLTSCIKEVDFGLGDGTEAPDILIVEAMLTDEIKKHQVILSTIDTILDLELDTVHNPFTPVRNLDRDFINYEERARVEIVDQSGNSRAFSEIAPGIYESDVAFAATMGNGYRLEITRANGRSFHSDIMAIEGVAKLDAMYPERMTNDKGVEGIGIFIDSSPVEGNAQNYRYTYEETYKIIAPRWSPLRYELTDYDPCALPEVTYNLELVPREVERRVCYKTEPSNAIVQAQATTTQDGLERFLVRFISRDDFIISHRYSIEVHQNVSSAASYGFYEQLDNFSRSDNVFSQVQPGFLEGNLFSEDNVEGSVLGFFDVVSVKSQRLFFDYEDFFPGEDLPPFPFDCGLHSSPESHVSYCTQTLFMNDCPQSVIERVNQDLITYVAVNSLNLGTCPGPDLYVATVCGDCTRLGSNEVPEFWIEE